MTPAPHPDCQEADARAVRVVVARTLAELAEHEAAWCSLLAAVEPNRALPMASPAWVQAWVKNRCPPSARFRCLFAYRGERLQGVLPLVTERHTFFGDRRPWSRVPTGEHAPAGNPLANGEDEVLAPLLEATFAERAVGLRMGDLREGSSVLAALQSGALGRWQIESRGAARVLDLDEDWAAFLARQGANQRRNLRKARNRLASDGSARFRLEPDGNADPATVEAFFHLERAGWKGRAGGAVADQPDLRRFYEDFVRGLAREGVLEWHQLHIGGRLAAMHMAARIGRTLTLLRIAFDESFGRLSPGMLLFAELLEREYALAEVDRVDCLTDMPWHERWNLRRLVCHMAHVYPPGLVPWFTAAAPEALRARARRSARIRAWVERWKGTRTP